MTIDFNFKIWNWGKLFQPEYPITCTCQKPNYPTTTNLVDDNMFPPNESFKICVISQLVRMKLQMLCVLWISGKELDNPYFRNFQGYETDQFPGQTAHRQSNFGNGSVYMSLSSRLYVRLERKVDVNCLKRYMLVFLHTVVK